MKSFTLYSQIQKALLDAINDPSFSAALPPLSDDAWERILGVSGQPISKMDGERLEFLGDALMWSTLGHQLYTQLSDGTPHMYTECRAALHSNMTFSCLAEKLDIMCVSSRVLKALTQRTFGEGKAAPSKSRPQIKATADLFEIVIGAYYQECGFSELCGWVNEMYRPLISVAKNAYLDNVKPGKSLRSVGVDLSLPPRPRVTLEPYQQNYTRGSRNKLKKRALMDRKVKLVSLATDAGAPVAPRQSECLRANNILAMGLNSSPIAVSQSCTPVFIDLTALDDSEEENNAITNLLLQPEDPIMSSPSRSLNFPPDTFPINENGVEEQELYTILTEGLDDSVDDPYGEQDMDISLDLDTDDSYASRDILLSLNGISKHSEDSCSNHKGKDPCKTLPIGLPFRAEREVEVEDADMTLVAYD